MALDKAKPTAMIKNATTAPLIDFDTAPAFGHLNGIITVPLAVQVVVPRTDDVLVGELVTTAHLRGSVAAAMSLRDALDKAIIAATKPAGVKLAS